MTKILVLVELDENDLRAAISKRNPNSRNDNVAQLFADNGIHAKIGWVSGNSSGSFGAGPSFDALFAKVDKVGYSIVETVDPEPSPRSLVVKQVSR
jgi:hypothetical protein